MVNRDVNFDESVYELIPMPYIEPERPPLYRSRFPGEVQPFAKPAKDHIGGGVGAHRTMGKITDKPSTQTFLKKYAKTKPLDATQTKPISAERAARRAKSKPGIPNRDEAPIMGLVSQKNYITANAVDNILAVPKRPQNTQINYLKKADFGRVPAYLDRVKAQVEAEYQMIAELQEQAREDDDDVELLHDEQRGAIVEGLKANWERINKEYQTLSFTLDTPAKKKRKEDYESMLEQIEQDIKKLSKKFVFVHREM